MLEAIQLAGHGGSIIRKIIELENKSKTEFEHVHVKTKSAGDNTIMSKGLTMVLEHDAKEKNKH